MNLRLAPINHLLAAEAWARARLQPFAGKVVHLHMIPPCKARITPAGTLDTAEPDAQPVLSVHLPLEALARLAVGDRDAALGAMHFSGDPALSATLQSLVRDLRWDAEDDLAQVIGDIAARRITHGARSARDWTREAGTRLGANVAEYLAQEERVLVAHPELDRLGREAEAIAARARALETRIGELERRAVR